MTEQKHDKLAYRRLARAGASIERKVAIADLVRLEALIASQAGEVECRLQFAFDSEQQVTIEGQLLAQLQLICQRCLETMTYVLEIPVQLKVVSDDAAAARLAAPFEPVLAEGDTLSLMTLLEDELLLNIPVIAKHDHEICVAT